MVMVSLICTLLAVLSYFGGFGMDLSPTIEEDEEEKFGSKIPVLLEYATTLESHVKQQYLKKFCGSGHRPFHHSIQNVCQQSNSLIYLAT